MIIVTSKTDNVILGIGEHLDYMDNGYPRLTDENVSFVTELVDIYENIPISAGIEIFKYCYTTNDKFTLNPNYQEPNKYNIPDDTLKQIQDDTVSTLIEEGSL